MKKPTKEELLQRAKDYALSKGGECLATEYISAKTKDKWKCKNPNHPIFETDFQCVTRGNWCVLCHLEEQAKKNSLSNGLELAQEHAAKEGGLCLSTEYKNAKTKMKWQCKANHIWEAAYDHVVNGGRWCKQCFLDESIIQDAYEQIQKRLKKEGKATAKISIEDKIKGHTKIEWSCENENHKPWFAEFRNVITKGGWCPYCAGKFSQDEYLELAQERAISKGGECLSTKYENQYTQLEWKCKTPKHPSWFSRYDKMMEHDSWCKECKYEEDQPIRDEYLKKAKKHALSKKGECLSTEYINSKTKLLGSCENKAHKPWEALYHNVTGTLDRWCPRCADQYSPEEWIEKAQKHALSKGGQFLSTKFKTVKDHYLWKCNDLSHPAWNTSMSNVLNGGTWCPECGVNIYYKENNTRIILEYLLGFELKRIRPKWNINPTTNNALELDGYNEKEKFAFEFQGRHHFDENVFNGSNLENVQYKDKTKKENCLKNEVFLLIIDDNEKINLIEDWISYIVEVLEENNINFNREFNYKELLNLIIEKNKTNYKEEYLERAKDYAISRGGKCLSEYYTNYDTPLKWKCENEGHVEWEAAIHIVAMNIWCPRCVGKFSKEEFLQKAKDYANFQKGECLSNEYINNKTNLEWKCENAEHPSWFRNIGITGRGSWCPKCPPKKDYFKNYKE